MAECKNTGMQTRNQSKSEAQIVTIDSYYYHYYQDPFIWLIIHFYCVVKIQGFFWFQTDFIKMSGYSRGEFFKKVRAGVPAHVAYMFYTHIDKTFFIKVNLFSLVYLKFLPWSYIWPNWQTLTSRCTSCMLFYIAMDH